MPIQKEPVQRRYRHGKSSGIPRGLALLEPDRVLFHPPGMAPEKLDTLGPIAGGSNFFHKGLSLRECRQVVTPPPFANRAARCFRASMAISMNCGRIEPTPAG